MVKTSNSFDFAIVGGYSRFILCHKLQVEYPQLNIVVFEKEQSLAAHQTGRNSGLFIQVYIIDLVLSELKTALMVESN